MKMRQIKTRAMRATVYSRRIEDTILELCAVWRRARRVAPVTSGAEAYREHLAWEWQEVLGRMRSGTYLPLRAPRKGGKHPWSGMPFTG